MSRYKGGYTVTRDEDLNPTVEFFPSKETITGDEAKKFLARKNILLRVLTVAFFPLTIVFGIVVGVHNATGWVIDKVFNS